MIQARKHLGILAGALMVLVATASMAADGDKGNSAAKLSSDAQMLAVP